MRTPTRATFSRRTLFSLLTFGSCCAIAESVMTYPLLQTGMFSRTHEYGITQNDMIRTASFLRRIRTHRRCRIRGKPTLVSEGVGVLDSTWRMQCQCNTV